MIAKPGGESVAQFGLCDPEMMGELKPTISHSLGLALRHSQHPSLSSSPPTCVRTTASGGREVHRGAGMMARPFWAGIDAVPLIGI